MTIAMRLYYAPEAMAPPSLFVKEMEETGIATKIRQSQGIWPTITTNPCLTPKPSS